MPKLHTTTYQVRVSADKFQTFSTTVVKEWSRAKSIAQRCIKKHGVEARILTVRSR
jgi:hypothetical protein